jgi:hypothetical protein
MNMCVVNVRYSADSGVPVLADRTPAQGPPDSMFLLFRGVLRLGRALRLLPVTSCGVQIRALVQILAGGGEMPVQCGLRALGGQEGKDRLTVF